MEDMIKRGRKSLKSFENDELPEGFEPDQRKGVDPPPLEKPFPEDAELIDLVNPESKSVIRLGSIPLIEAINERQSRRRFADDSLSLEELSFLLWTTQGVREVDKKKVWTKRTVPSGGARQPFETYLIVNRVEGLEPGVYRYLPLEHKLMVLYKTDVDMPEIVSKACYGQSFVGNSAVVFAWATIPYRTEWRYSIIGHKDIAIEAGHVCQNLYLACESIGAGTCAIAAYEQKGMDSILKLDGEDEFTIYVAPVGKPSAKED